MALEEILEIRRRLEPMDRAFRRAVGVLRPSPQKRFEVVLLALPVDVARDPMSTGSLAVCHEKSWPRAGAFVAGTASSSSYSCQRRIVPSDSSDVGRQPRSEAAPEEADDHIRIGWAADTVDLVLYVPVARGARAPTGTAQWGSPVSTR